MMKKLLILVLVMGVATTANATLTLVSSAGDTLDPDGVLFPSTTVIGIHNDLAEPGQGLITYPVISVGAVPLGKWTGVANVYAPPSLGGTNTYYGVMDLMNGMGDLDIWQSDLAAASTDPYGIGILADYEFECLGEGPVVISLLGDDTVTVLDSITINQVPEPITFGLLGLGGLFLRRRK
jgi:hypothetical protein